MSNESRPDTSCTDSVRAFCFMCRSLFKFHCRNSNTNGLLGLEYTERECTKILIINSPNLSVAQMSARANALERVRLARFLPYFLNIVTTGFLTQSSPDFECHPIARILWHNGGCCDTMGTFGKVSAGSASSSGTTKFATDPSLSSLEVSSEDVEVSE